MTDETKTTNEKQEKPETVVEEVETTEVAEQPQEAPTDPNSLIALAVKQEASVETLERLFELQQKVQASNAKSAFTKAMSELQSELPIIKKLKQGHVAMFAPLEDIIHETKEPIKKHGFSYRWNTQQNEKYITVTCIATHIDGHSEETTMTSEQEEVVTGNQSGKATKSAPQRAASTITFLKRYTFVNMFGVTVAGEDFDGRMEQMKPKLPANPKAKIMSLLKSLNVDTSDGEVIKEEVKKLTGDELVEENFDEIISKLTVLWQERQENHAN